VSGRARSGGATAHPLRRALDALYRAGGALGALFLLATCVLILMNVAGSLLHVVTRSLDEFAGYCMAASAFLALAYTLRAGEHIRMSLGLQSLPERLRMPAEFLATAIGTLMAGFLAWNAAKLCLVSYRINDLSQGIIPLPLWIPQSAMAVGSAIFALAMADRLVCIGAGWPVPEDQSDARTDR
jgi:TRAP-type C4-dicarboxylate transport system permease small subunit